MQIVKTLSVAACSLVAVAAIVTATPAQSQEPHYLAAISELRTARDYISADTRPGFDEHRHRAVDEITKAIQEIKRAAWDDGKNTQFVPQQGGGSWAPMHTAKRFLDAARAHVAQGADNPANIGLRERALRHIDEAEHSVDQIIRMSDQRQ